MCNSSILDGLKDLITCFISTPIDDGNLAVCTTEGYLLEISHKIIINNCYTGVKNAGDACLYYQYEDNGIFQTFYVIRGGNADLVVVAKNGNNLEVIERRSGIHSFRITDLENSGKPKLLIYSSSNNYEVFGQPDVEMCEISENVANESVTNCIPVALQDLHNQHDQLKKEILFKKSLIRRRLAGNCSPENSSLPVIGRTIEFSESMHVVKREPLLMITDTWERITGNFWVTALHVKSSLNRAVGQLTVVCKSSKIREYQWTTYQPVDSSASFLIIIAVAIPDLGRIGQIRNQFEVRYSDGVITSPEFRLTSKKVVSGDLELFHSGNLAHDLPCVHLTHILCDLTISQAITPAHPFTDTLKTDLNLREVPQLDTPDSIYFTTRCHQFSGLLIHLQKISKNRLNFKIYARTQEQLFLFVSAVKETAPYGSKLELAS